MTITWFKHSRRMEPISLSIDRFCHGLDGLEMTSLMPIPATRRRNARVTIDRIAISQQPQRRGCEMSQTAIARIWKAFALQPHRVDTFKLSKDPLFIDKVRDIVGLYLDPPARAALVGR